MRTCSVWFSIAFAASLVLGAPAQEPATPAAAPHTAPIERRDPAVDAANALVGRALILRCFCSENNLAFDAEGHPHQPVKPTDWTLAGVNVLKAERKAAGTVELDGVRVAVRFAPDRGEFDRHAMNDEKVKILVADDGTAAGFAHTLDAVFSDGIDLRLQRAMPSYWLHYFVPKTPWPKDDLDGAAIVVPGASGVTDPKPTKRSEPSYSAEAAHDHVQGTVLVMLVVDKEGMPRRPMIVQPLGYGLDASTIEATEKDRFQPASNAGKNVAAYQEIRQSFTTVPMPH